MPNRHIDGPGPLSFHAGVDISAAGGTAVYAVAPGRVCTLDGESEGHPTTVGVCGRGFEFAYSHINPVVGKNQRLVKHQLLGYVIERWGHLHFAEMWDGRTWNPLRAKGLTPYDDHTKPTIVSAMVYRHGRYLLASAAPLSGRVGLAVDAFDTPELKSNWPWAKVTPALIRWSLLSEASGETVISNRIAVDFRLNKLKTPLTGVFAPGTRQNGSKRAGVYNFWLVRALDSSKLPNGAYRLIVRASDTRGNTASRTFRLTVSN